MNKKKIQSLLKKERYIQGINAVPIYVTAGPYSGLISCKKILGYNYSNFILDFKSDYCEFYYFREDLHHMFDEFIKRYNKDNKYLDWLYATSEKEKKKLMNYIKNKLKNIHKLNDKNLINEYKKLILDFYNCFGASHLVEAISLTTDIKIKDLLLKALDRKGLIDKFTQYFTDLTQPVNHFFFSDYNLSMLKMVNLIKDNKKLSKLFSQKVAIIQQKIDHYKEFKKLINRHLRIFYWLKSSFGKGREYTKVNVIEEIKDMINNKAEIKITSNADLKKNLKRKQHIFKELEFSKDLQELIKITDFVTYWQDERKIVILSGCWALEKFVKEISQRFNINPSDFKYLLVNELNDLSKVDKDKLAERRKGSIYIYDKIRTEILVGREYLDLKNKLVSQRKSDDVKELNGMCASTGKVIGRVKVCLSEGEISKVKKGDVLVTAMTRPEFVPAMKKAVAVVTDEGGLTCHAAVISRELGIPCVIATKIATKVLKDNDLVEVNANHGIVKIIKGAKK